MENGIPVTKLMQIFSKQAGMMDALIAHFAEQMRRRRDGGDGQPPDNGVHDGECFWELHQNLHPVQHKIIACEILQNFCYIKRCFAPETFSNSRISLNGMNKVIGMHDDNMPFCKVISFE